MPTKYFEHFPNAMAKRMEHLDRKIVAAPDLVKYYLLNQKITFLDGQGTSEYTSYLVPPFMAE